MIEGNTEYIFDDAVTERSPEPFAHKADGHLLLLEMDFVIKEASGVINAVSFCAQISMPMILYCCPAGKAGSCVVTGLLLLLRFENKLPFGL